MVIINPNSLPRPTGFNHGIKNGPLLFISGQIAYDKAGKLISRNFAKQFRKSMENLLAVAKKAGFKPENIVKMTIFVKNKSEYQRSRKELGKIYKSLMGSYYPSISLIIVKDLFEKGAKVEIEAVAAS